MTTCAELDFETFVTKQFENPEWIGTTSDYLRRLNGGFFSEWYRDMIFQKWDRYPTSIYDAYAFSQVHVLFGLAKVVVARIDIGEPPKEDDMIESNNNILSTLGGNFRGSFWGGNHDEDGFVTVEEPIEFNVKSRVTNEAVIQNVSGTFPLEVGYISPLKTLSYLNRNDGKLARWPYGSDTIYLMARIQQ